VPIEQEDRTYVLKYVLSWINVGTLELESRTITRKDGGVDTPYTTTLAYSGADFGDYHHPYLITEEGPAGTRTTQRAFVHKPTTYVLALLDSETVEVDRETYTNSWTYDDNGFKTAETIRGITTQFHPDSRGDVPPEN
jgi:hypothetical protein